MPQPFFNISETSDIFKKKLVGVVKLEVRRAERCAALQELRSNGMIFQRVFRRGIRVSRQWEKGNKMEITASVISG